MLSVTEAINQLLDAITPVNTIQINIRNALGYILAQQVLAQTDLPYFSNSSMDGFAVHAIDTSLASPSNGVSLEIEGEIPAGKTSSIPLGMGKVVRVMTGAPLPPGADSVVPVEFTNLSFQSLEKKVPKRVDIYSPVNPGDYVRKKGADVQRGSLVMASGKRLRPQEIGFLATLGIEAVEVFRKPRIAVLSTGDELTSIGTMLAPGKIYDSNSYSLGALIEQNYCEVIPLGIAGDTIDAVKEKLDLAINLKVDLIITSAGVSVGAFDIVREVLNQWGYLEFWRINMRPGKPVAFGKFRDTHLIGLPGNPVSAFIGFEVICKPSIQKMSGLKKVRRTSIKVKITEPIESDGRESYLRAWVWCEGDQLLAKLVSHQGSGNLHSLVQANALLIVPSEVKSLPIDAEINAWILEDQLNLDI